MNTQKKWPFEQKIKNAIDQFYDQRKGNPEDRKALAKNIREIDKLLKEIQEEQISQNLNLDENAKIPDIAAYTLNMDHLPPFAQNLLPFAHLSEQMMNRGRKTAAPKIHFLSEDVTMTEKDVFKSEGQITLNIQIQENATLYYTMDGKFPIKKTAKSVTVQTGQRTVPLTINDRCILRMVAKQLLKEQSDLVSVELIPQSTTQTRRGNMMCKHNMRMEMSVTGESEPIFPQGW